MKLNKKYLIANGCSFTEGHNLGKDGAWPKFLGEELGLEVINLGKGGYGNEWIVQDTISYATIESSIAKDSLFVIQLSECLRHLVHFDLVPNTYGDLTEESRYYNITPGIFIGKGGLLHNESPVGWHDDTLHKTIQKGSKYLVHFYCNITFALLKTYWNIINLVNFCENNDYPYLIYDGMNPHIPEKKGFSKWILRNADRLNEEVLQINVGNIKFHARPTSAKIQEDLIDYIKNLKYYYRDTTLWQFIHRGKYNENDEYHKGNDDHPNELGAKMWAKHLVGVLKEKFDE